MTESDNIKPVTVSVGGVWEDDAWQVQFHCRSGHAYRSKYNEMVMSVPGGTWSPWSAKPCPHAVDVVKSEVKHYPKNKWRGQESWEESKDWTVPRVVVAWNEAGFGTTGVCLDCILDWGAANVV